MPRTRPDVVIFRFDERAELLAVMEELAPRGGWLTLQPGFDADAPEDDAAFGRSMPVLPTCTWVPGERSRRHGHHVAVGIDHKTRSKVVHTLAERVVPVPASWVVAQDHQTRGLVLAVPPDEPHEVVLDWLLRAGLALSLATLTGEWRALVYRT